MNERLPLYRVTGRLSRGGACTPELLTGAAPPISRTILVVSTAIPIVVPVIGTPPINLTTIGITIFITIAVPATGAAYRRPPSAHSRAQPSPPISRPVGESVHRRSIGQSAL